MIGYHVLLSENTICVPFAGNAVILTARRSLNAISAPETCAWCGCHRQRTACFRRMVGTRVV